MKTPVFRTTCRFSKSYFSTLLYICWVESQLSFKFVNNCVTGSVLFCGRILPSKGPMYDVVSCRTSITGLPSMWRIWYWVMSKKVLLVQYIKNINSIAFAPASRTYELVFLNLLNSNGPLEARNLNLEKCLCPSQFRGHIIPCRTPVYSQNISLLSGH